MQQISWLFAFIIQIQTCTSFLLPPLYYPDQDCPLVSETEIFEFFKRNGTRTHWTRPVRNFSDPVAITFELYVRSIVLLDEKHQEMFVRGSLFFTWKDEFRIWNNSYLLNCIDTVTLPFGEETNIWTPNIFFSNS